MEKLNDFAYFIHRYLRHEETLKGRQECFLAWLESEGLDFNSRGARGETVIHALARAGALDGILVGGSLGFDLFEEDLDGNNLLHYAFDLNVLGQGQGGDTESVIKWAVKNGFDINHQNKNGETPLFLLGPGALQRLTSDDSCTWGETPDQDDIERLNGLALRLLELFVASGGDIRRKNNQGQFFSDGSYTSFLSTLTETLRPFYSPLLSRDFILDGMKKLRDERGDSQELLGIPLKQKPL